MPVLSRVRAALLARAAELDHGRTDNPDICLLVDGVVLYGDHSGVHVTFTVPADATSVRLQSRQFVPAHMTADSIDTRRLGVGVSSISVDGAHYDAGTAKGWHNVEPGIRWTDGDGHLPGVQGQVKVSLVPLGSYWVAGAAVPLEVRSARAA